MLVTRANAVRASRPSIAQAYQVIHRHNVVLTFDTWFIELDQLVSRWLAAGVDAAVVAQLASFVATFNSKNLIRSLASLPTSRLPIQDASIVRNERAMESFLQKVPGNIFSIRFSSFLYNDDAPDVKREMLRVLTREEIVSLGELKEFDEKLRFCSRKKGWSDDVASAFYGKNCVNVLHHLGRRHPELKVHRVADMDKHPHGPGARALYGVVGLSWRQLRKRLRSMLPTHFYYLNRRWSLAFSDVDCEFVQFNACAASRLMNYLTSGTVQPHMKRNKELGVS